MSHCKACDEPLVLRVGEDDEDVNDIEAGEETVPDDLQLPCGCHFHWQCFLDESSSVAVSLKCPSCDQYLPRNEAGPSTTNQFLHTTSGASILTRYTNEGGTEENLDILPSVTEEAYLQNNPEARPARALHVMCSEGDVGGIVVLLHDAGGEGADVGALIRYQDPLANMKSGLHLAIESGQEEVAWLLLWLSSTVPDEVFPQPAVQAAQSMGVGRLNVGVDADIRSLKDTCALATIRIEQRGLLARLRPLSLTRPVPTRSRRPGPTLVCMLNMASGTPSKPAEKSILTSAVESINPWASSRTQTPTPNEKAQEAPKEASAGKSDDPGDHSSNHLYGQSFRSYPPDCPPLNVQWFHAVDVPKRKPKLLQGQPNTKPPAKPILQPKKFSAFSASDSKAIENGYQNLLEAAEASGGISAQKLSRKRPRTAGNGNQSNTTLGSDENTSGTGTRVPVNEDFLFDVDIEKRELAPVYWLGPIYEVRRGTWFFQEGSNLRPCEENLASQLEEGYLKIKPWLNPVRARSQSSAAKDITPKASRDNLKADAVPPSPTTAQPQSHRLFGTYLNSAVTYQDANVAWLSSDGMLSWVTSTMYERFAGGGYMSGVKLVRGYVEATDGKSKEEKASTGPAEESAELDERQKKLLKRRSAPPSTKVSGAEQSFKTPSTSTAAQTRQARLQRQLSSLMENKGRNKAETEEEVRMRQEQEIQDDYNTEAGETQGREIEHLVLVTHGIGQLLGLRMENVNFVHDVNVLRKTLKSVYAESADLKTLNSEPPTGHGNCRVQVLPVCWRHLVNFPKQRGKKDEQDIGDVEEEEASYPSLEDITIEGVAFARSLISDLALDVLLYQSSYREEISRIVLSECNRIIRLFRQRNPDFKGKIHIMGHSLGSAIFFDLLCRQREDDTHQSTLRMWPSQGRQAARARDRDMMFDFDVEDFYCLGSPVGLFQMVKGRTIAARHSPHALPSESPLNLDMTEDPFFTGPMGSSGDTISPITGLPASISSPKVAQLFNIFHPSDPISYRLEPLISPAMASLKPQLLPYTKKGIFSNVAPQGLTEIGVMVGQSVSGLWSSLSAGITNNLLNRTRALTNEEMSRMTDSADAAGTERSAGAGTNIIAGDVIADASKLESKTKERRKKLVESSTAGGSASNNGKDPTLIDDELETLFSRFQKTRTGLSQETQLDKPHEDEDKARKMRAEESKVRALNRNGRVDYSIQESVLDFNPINTIASHLGYWGDEDRPSQIRRMLEDDDMPVADSPEDEGTGAPRQSYNFAPGYHGVVYRADTPDWGAGPRHGNARGDDAEPREAGKQAPEGHAGRGVPCKLQAMRWGLIPFWTKRNPDYASMMKTINCRDDSLSSPGGMWASMKGRKRCIVIAQGFFEWLKVGSKEKVPHFVKRGDGHLMCFAGLWDCVQYEDSEEKVYTYTIITTDSNPQLKFLHDRMPVILNPGSEDLRTWLDPSRHEWSAELQSLLKPFQGQLDVYPVSKDVGKVGNNSPSFIIPVNSKENKANIANFFSNATPKKKAAPSTQAQSPSRVPTTDEVGAKIKTEETLDEEKKRETAPGAKHLGDAVKRKASAELDDGPPSKAANRASPEKPKTRSATKNESRGSSKAKSSDTPKITKFFAANSA
ncbi:putative phospholipase C20G8.02 [Paramyrothecium foliicola]|nr:putative phospholipase C20G8.02 [Paramyrothecium foliicola]